MSFPWDIITLLKWKIVSAYIGRITLLQQKRELLPDKPSVLLTINTTTQERGQRVHTHTHTPPTSWAKVPHPQTTGKRGRDGCALLTVTRTQGWWTVYTYWQSPASTTGTKPPKVPWSQTGTHWIWISGKKFYRGEGTALLHLPVPPKAYYTGDSHTSELSLGDNVPWTKQVYSLFKAFLRHFCLIIKILETTFKKNALYQSSWWFGDL